MFVGFNYDHRAIFTTFHNEFSSFIEKLIFKGDAVVVVGDFNLWVDEEENIDAKEFTMLMNGYGLNQQVQEPTHRKGHTLDQIYVNEFQMNVNHKVINETHGLKTDHFPLVFELPAFKTNQKTRPVHLER